MFLAGDIGGTNTRLALFEGDPNQLKPVVVEIFPSRDHSGLEEIARAFVDKNKCSFESACFGIAGAIRDGRVQTPNLPWVVEAAHVAAALGLASVTLINDLEANAHGIALLDPSDFAALHEGVASPTGNRGLISAGTGLGQAGLLFEPAGYRPFPSEGGHVDFAPRNELEIALLEYLFKRFEHVSYERVLSGPGLFNIYQFLRDTGRYQEPPWLAEQIAAGNATAVVSRSGVEGTSEICSAALDIFCSIYGAEAGNLALKLMATGGMFIGGGIAPKILKKLAGPAFMKAFLSKGRISPLLESIPVRVITNDRTALLGAGRVAAFAATRKHARGV